MSAILGPNHGCVGILFYFFHWKSSCWTEHVIACVQKNSRNLNILNFGVQTCIFKFFFFLFLSYPCYCGTVIALIGFK
ncbi:hypothetical protein BpHYR1_032114 [Brachionus plicatilis]|uniref:Uncharacterized protein n=1 Tax=Brachionus plicatilis TaxID=10195 RepID=A0A3M7RD07_BRAPC|nr:hypothetical protein BpHYR1_032114 [Brachionus plicatilis]